MDIVFKHPWRAGIVVEPFRNHTRPDSPRGPLYTQRYGHSPRHDRINKRNVPAPRHRRRSSQGHLNIVRPQTALYNIHQTTMKVLNIQDLVGLVIRHQGILTL